MNAKKVIAIILSFVLVFALAACSAGTSDEGSSADKGETVSINIAYQYGISYAPLLIMKAQGLIEECYDGNVEVTWTQLSSGPDINEAFASGRVDMAAMGVAPAIMGIMNKIPYRIYSNISAQPHKLMTTSAELKALADITDEQIALVKIGSIQHILLAMACEKELGDARTLDDNIVGMSHPDGMTALLSGTVPMQLTTSPYTFQEEASEEADVHVLYDLEKVWPQGNSFIVGLASTKLYENNPELYEAVCEATRKAMDYINNNTAEAAAELSGLLNCEPSELAEWMNDPACVYDATPKGVMDMADFMVRAKFIDAGPSSLKDVAYENVSSLADAS